jgi:hypothetical protein
VIMGHWLGFWEFPCPFYGEKKFQERVKQDVLDMVNLYKDEPGVLMWLLGNENNYSCLGEVNPWTADEVEKETDPRKKQVLKARIYYSFINDIAKEIHAQDPNHPVAMGNGELLGLDIAAQICPDIDIIGCIIYRGKSFGNLFGNIRQIFDKPVYLSEFGADAYNAFSRKEDQNMQAFFLESQVRQAYANSAFAKGGSGNCIGGTIFEWTDEWWKHNANDEIGWSVQDTESNWSNASYYFDIQAERNMNMNEEWFGLMALSGEEKEVGLDKRIPRKAYYVIRDFWRNPGKNGTGINKKKGAAQ